MHNNYSLAQGAVRGRVRAAAAPRTAQATGSPHCILPTAARVQRGVGRRPRDRRRRECAAARTAPPVACATQGANADSDDDVEGGGSDLYPQQIHDAGCAFEEARAHYPTRARRGATAAPRAFRLESPWKRYFPTKARWRAWAPSAMLPGRHICRGSGAARRGCARRCGGGEPDGGSIHASKARGGPAVLAGAQTCDGSSMGGAARHAQTARQVQRGSALAGRRAMRDCHGTCVPSWGLTRICCSYPR